MENPESAGADLVLHNGRIFTSRPGALWASGVAVADGRFVSVGRDDDVLRAAGPAARRVDLGGRTVIPGINDAHAHVAVTWNTSEVELDLPFDPTLDEVGERIVALDDGGQGWVSGRVFTGVLTDPRVHRDVLDAYVPDRPVLLYGMSGHGVVVNSEGLRRLQMDGERVPVVGGWFDRCGDGRHRGVMHEYEGWEARRRLPPAGWADTVAGYASAAERAPSVGVTSVQQMAGDLPIDRVVDALREAPPAIRWRAIAMSMPSDSQMPLDLPEVGDPPPMVRVDGRKWILDGTPVEGDAWVREPWFGLGHAGRPNFTQGQVVALLDDALERDAQLHLHVCGDATAAAVLDAVEATGGADAWSGRRLRIEHGDLLDRHLTERFAAIGAVVVQNPVHFGLTLHDHLGPERSASRFLLRDLPRIGVGFALGSDTVIDPWRDLLLATTAPSSPGQGLSREEAVIAMTAGAAYAEFREHDKGTIAVGMAADLVVLDTHIFDVEPGELPATRALWTLVGGVPVHAEGPFVAV